MNEDKYFHRTRLLETFTEKKYSQEAKHEIMLRFGVLKKNQKEETAKKAIPLVQNSKTEKEAVEAVLRLVEQTKED